MVQPGVRVLSLLQQVSREFGRRKHGSSPCGHYWSRDDTRCMMASLRAVMGRISKSNVTYTITVSNTGRPGKGLTAEYVTVTLPLLRGRDPDEVTTIAEATTGGGYTGIHCDTVTHNHAAEFQIPEPGPPGKPTFTIKPFG